MPLISESFAGVATAATRAVELYTPREMRLFDDPYALSLLPPVWQVVFRLLYMPGLRQALLRMRERRLPGSLGSILCRTRYIDDVLKKTLEAGMEQVVILGAGFDSRAYRITGMEHVRVFEVDLPGARALKQRRLEQALGAVPPNVTLLGMDFDRQDLGSELSGAGYQDGLKTLFIWEGVTQYITAQAVEATLGYVARHSGAGSAIVFTYVLRGIIDGTARAEWVDTFLEFTRRVGSPLKFGLDPAGLEEYLSERGFRLVEQVGADEYQQRYLVPLGRGLAVFEGEHAVYAEVAVPERET